MSPTTLPRPGLLAGRRCSHTRAAGVALVVAVRRDAGSNPAQASQVGRAYCFSFGFAACAACAGLEHVLPSKQARACLWRVGKWLGCSSERRRLAPRTALCVAQGVCALCAGTSTSRRRRRAPPLQQAVRRWPSGPTRTGPAPATNTGGVNDGEHTLSASWLRTQTSPAPPLRRPGDHVSHHAALRW